MTVLALFDLDNTLLDRERAFRLWVDDFVASQELGEGARTAIQDADADGFRPRDEFFTELKGVLPLRDSLESLLADYHVSYPSRYRIDSETLVSIRRLRSEGYKVGVVTNGPPSQWAKFEAAGIEAEFDAVSISSVVGSWKPDFAIFENAARQCGLALDGWMVGDSPAADIAGGIKAGLRTIWMTRGRVWGEDSYAPEFTAASIPEAVEIILRETSAS